MTFAICFDFPETDTPWFAGWCGNGTLGLAPSLRTAATWDSEEVAERILATYGPETRECGVVVELAA